MHFSFVVSSKLGYQIPNLFSAPESFAEFETALKLLRENGFEGVELNLNFDDHSLHSKIEESLSQSGLRLAAVGTGMLYSLNELSFTDPDPTIRAKAVSIVKELMKFASAAHAPVVIGLVRGMSPLLKESTADWLRDCLIECESAGRKYGSKFALEAINRYETKSLNSAAEVVTFIENAGLKATGLLLDTFHMNIEERSIEATIKEHVSKIAHFHMADSNRWPPGYGHLNIESTLKQLENLGYDGWVSAETLPRPTSKENVKATADYLRRSGLISH